MEKDETDTPGSGAAFGGGFFDYFAFGKK